jgi:hypothetical protein
MESGFYCLVNYDFNNGTVMTPLSSMNLSNPAPTAPSAQAVFQCDFRYLVKYTNSIEEIYDVLVLSVKAENDELADMKKSVTEDKSFREYLSRRKVEINQSLSESSMQLAQSVTPSGDMLKTNARLTGQLCAVDKMIYLLNVRADEKATSINNSK